MYTYMHTYAYVYIVLSMRLRGGCVSIRAQCVTTVRFEFAAVGLPFTAQS